MYKKLTLSELKEMCRGSGYRVSHCETILDIFAEILPSNFVDMMSGVDSGIYIIHIGGTIIYVLRNMQDIVMVYTESDLPYIVNNVFYGHYRSDKWMLIKDILNSTESLTLTDKLNLIKYYFRLSGVSKNHIELFTNKLCNMPSKEVFVILTLILASYNTLNRIVSVLTSSSLVELLDALDNYNDTLEYIITNQEG